MSLKPPAAWFAGTSAFRDFVKWCAETTAQYPTYTVATLPIGTLGMRAQVTDATAPTFLGALTGGGAVKCPVFHNGTSWVAG